MKKKEKTILCMLIATVFLVLFMGNTVVSEDRGEKIYYFSSYDDRPGGEAWETNPGDMVDGNERTYASTTIDGDVELCDENTADTLYSDIITKVEIRANASYCGSQCSITLRPVFPGGDGYNHIFTPEYCKLNWSEWFDITNDPNAPRTWGWGEVANLDCDVVANGESFLAACSMVQIRVTHIPR